MCHLSTEFCENWWSNSCIILLANKQKNTDKNITSVVEATVPVWSISRTFVRGHIFKKWQSNPQLRSLLPPATTTNTTTTTISGFCLYTSVYNFSPFLSHGSNSNWTVMVSSFNVNTYSIVLIDFIDFYYTLFIISHSAIFAASMSINVQFSSV